MDNKYRWWEIDKTWTARPWILIFMWSSLLHAFLDISMMFA